MQLLGVLICLTLFGAPQSVAQAPPVPEYYGVFLWDGQALQEMKEQKRVLESGPLRQPVRLSSVKTSNSRPSFVMFDRSLRTTGPGPITVKPLKHVVQRIVFLIVPGCQPADYWDTDDRAGIETRVAPAGSNPEMVRVVLVSDISPGWYALSAGTSAFAFGVQVDAFNPATALAESFESFGGSPVRVGSSVIEKGLLPLGTYLRQNPAAGRAPDWKCLPPGRFASPAQQPSAAPAPNRPAGNESARLGAQGDARIPHTLANKYPDAQAFPVEHAHANPLAAKCEGVLYVFKDHLKYEVEGVWSRDSFEAPLSELAEVKTTFALGFQIKLRSGRTYRFVTPNGKTIVDLLGRR